MNTINPEYKKFIIPIINESPFFIKDNMKLTDLDYGEAFVEIDIEKKHLQAYGQVHGGVYGGLIDAAAWWAIYTKVEGNQNAVTAEMKLNYLSGASKGKFLAHGKCIKLGKRLGLGEATIKNEDGKLLAHGTITVMIIDGTFREADKIPPKLI